MKIEYPEVKPVLEGIHRPFWSIMIPTYNCAQYLSQTLESVLTQDLGSQYMQIEVVDDCSSDNPKRIVDELGQGRVGFYQQSKNVGLSKNFNTCVNRASGHWIHILHGDDMVEPCFYEKMYELALQYPNAGLLVSRSFYVDEHNNLIDISSRLENLETYSYDPLPFLYSNPFRTPSVVVSRNFYETYGGFCLNLSHCADWDLWIRAINSMGGISTNLPLTRYRMSPINHTSKLMKTGENVQDFLRIGMIFQMQFSDFSLNRFYKFISELAREQARLFEKLEELEAAKANYKIWWKYSPFKSKVYWILKDFNTRIFQRS